MLLFALKRTSALVITLAAVSVMTFGAFSYVKGDSALIALGTQATAQTAAARRAQLGIDKSLGRQYAKWLIGLFHGDMGFSTRYKKSVCTLFLQSLPITLKIGILSFAIACVAGITLGAAVAYVKGAVGAAVEALIILCLSIPDFFLSVIVICVFSLILHLFVPGGEGAASVLFPSLVIATAQSAILAKFASSAIKKECSSLYVRTVRLRGATGARVFLLHILPNALISLLPLVSMIAANVFTGQVIVEEVFGIAGLGRLLVSAVLYRDVPLCRALVLFIAYTTCILNFAVDMIVRALDKRVAISN